MKFMTTDLKSVGAFVAIVCGLSLVLTGLLQAQVTEAPVAQEEVSGQMLEPFAGAYKEVSEIHTSYKQRIVESVDPGQADALQQEANKKMTQAVTDHGMTIEDYNTLFQSIQNDPALKKKFMTVLNQDR